MPARQPSALFFRLWALLLLATIGLQAAQPLGAPLERSHGSAFTAATFEMVVAPPRREEPGDTTLTPQPLDPWVPAAALRENVAGQARVASGAPIEPSVPQAQRHRHWRPLPHAPPIA